MIFCTVRRAKLVVVDWWPRTVKYACFPSNEHDKGMVNRARLRWTVL